MLVESMCVLLPSISKKTLLTKQIMSVQVFKKDFFIICKEVFSDPTVMKGSSINLLGSPTHYFGMICPLLWSTIGFVCKQSAFTNDTKMVVVPFTLGVSIMFFSPVMPATLHVLVFFTTLVLSMFHMYRPFLFKYNCL